MASTLATQGEIAVLAARRAITTKGCIAPFAGALLFARHPPATVTAVDAVPAVEGHMGAVGVVRFEDLPHEHEEVE